MTISALGIPVFILSALAAAVLTGLVRAMLIKRAILDHPNHRSSHSIPTPRGGGLAVVAVITLSWGGLYAGGTALPASGLAILGLGLVLAILSWLDDIRTLSASVRLVVHMGVVAAALTTIEGPIISHLLPFWLDRLIAFLAWVWFINLFNFMDGIDGISGIETLTISLGLVIIALSLGGTIAALMELSLVSLGVAGAVLGFMTWNWHPAKIFLGDVGSVTLGFFLGWLLISLSAAGFLASAVCLALYYLVDATWTLMKRAKRGDKVWHAHREHAYQRATQSGLRHDQVTGVIALGNGVLIIAAVICATGATFSGLAIAAITALGLMLFLGSQGSEP